jgi:hypothetical protein
MRASPVGWVEPNETFVVNAHRAPLVFKAIMTLPQPTAFLSLVKGFDGECPCCRRKFADAV